VGGARGVEVARIGVGEKLAHMEDIVNLHVRGEVESARCRRGSLDDLEGADEPGFELGGRVEMGEIEIMSREAHHVADGVGDIATMLVGIVPLTLLSMRDGLMSFGDVVVDELKAGCRRGVGRVDDEGGREKRMVTIVEVKGGETCRGGDGVVVGELEQR
jgi:hypothetical protein